MIKLLSLSHEWEWRPAYRPEIDEVPLLLLLFYAPDESKLLSQISTSHHRKLFAGLIAHILHPPEVPVFAYFFRFAKELYEARASPTQVGVEGICIMYTHTKSIVPPLTIPTCLPFCVCMCALLPKCAGN